MPLMDSLTFLDRLDKAKPQSLYVLHGNEPFLKRQVQQAIRRLVLGPEDDGFALSVFPGDKASWAAVHEDLRTLPVLAPHRLVVIENADPFVTQERARLEKLFPELTGKEKPAGVLVLDVQAWASSTKLAKLTPDASLIVCDTPGGQQLP